MGLTDSVGAACPLHRANARSLSPLRFASRWRKIDYAALLTCSRVKPALDA